MGDHIDIVNGFAFKGELFGTEGIPVIKIGNVNRSEFSAGSMQYYKYDESLKRFEVRPGDLLVSLTGTVGKEDFGNVCRASDDFEVYYLNQRNAKLLLHPELVPEYLMYLLRNEFVKKRLVQSGTGVRQCHLHNKDLNGIMFVLPAIEVQKKFAEFIQQSDKSKHSYHIGNTT